MPSDQTTNYRLSQWAKPDQVRMEDFNADNAKIDAAIKAVDQRVDGLAGSKVDKTALTALASRVAGLETKDREGYIAVGSYEEVDKATPRTVALPWEPKFLLLLGEMNGHDSIAFVTQDFSCYAQSSINFYQSDYLPRLEGASLKLNVWFNEGTTRYIAFR